MSAVSKYRMRGNFTGVLCGLYVDTGVCGVLCAEPGPVLVPVFQVYKLPMLHDDIKVFATKFDCNRH